MLPEIRLDAFRGCWMPSSCVSGLDCVVGPADAEKLGSCGI